MRSVITDGPVFRSSASIRENALRCVLGLDREMIRYRYQRSSS